MIQNVDVIIIGAGAAGLMCAGVASQRGRRVIVLDHSPKLAEKIRISGGGRCNFTNRGTQPKNFISQNPRFCVSALSRFTPQDFIAMVERHGIPYHEKTLGQLFCDNSAKDIIDMLVRECDPKLCEIRLNTPPKSVEKRDDNFIVHTDGGDVFQAPSLVIATGGLSIPKIGASPFGYKIAEQFGIPVIAPRAGLVPMVFDESLIARTKELSGLSVPHVHIKTRDGTEFEEALLFTHKGLSGPAILQASSYWHNGEAIEVDFYPALDILSHLKSQRTAAPKSQLLTILSDLIPKRLAQFLILECGIDGRMADLSDKALNKVATTIKSWTVVPHGIEGYRTAEVTLGGVDTTAISSKTFECNTVKGLYFIGEVLDVTGHLGGYNFQWAWASGWCAGAYV